MERAQWRHATAEEGSMESGWAVLSEELLTQVLEALLSSVRLRGLGAGLGDGAAGVQWVEVPPRRAGDVAVAETGHHRRGRGACWCGAAVESLDLKCYALTDEALQAVSSLTTLTSLELQGDGRRARLTSKRRNTPKPV
jgi:hypothetical protein